MPIQMTKPEASDYLKRGFDALNSGDVKDSISCAQLVLKYFPKLPQAHYLVGLCGLETSQWRMAGEAFKNTVSLDKTAVLAWAQLARVFLIQGQMRNADQALQQALKLGITEPTAMDTIGTVYSMLGDQYAALDWYDKAIDQNDSAMVRLNRGKTYTFTGDFDLARVDLDYVINQHPAFGMPHWLLARLSKAKSDAHIHEMQKHATSIDDRNPSAPFFWYAIGKEHEDLEQWDKAFEAFERGAQAQHSQRPFDEKADIALFEALEKHYTTVWLARKTVDDQQHNQQGNQTTAPIFIIGQPRTGSTLIERVITAHPLVHSAGELQQFRMAIRRLVNIPSTKPMTAEIIEKAVDIDTVQLGRIYMETSVPMQGDPAITPYFVDKLPLNYLYVPLIIAALPNAKIIHINRSPMDSCFASFKQLFADAYLHSYDQTTMAEHYVRYHKLMDVWRQRFPNAFLDVNYEDVTSDLPNEAKRIIDFIGLDWDAAILDFYIGERAVTTASAAQVREKAHSKSVGRWKQYGDKLATMQKILQHHHIIQ